MFQSRKRHLDNGDLDDDDEDEDDHEPHSKLRAGIGTYIYL